MRSLIVQVECRILPPPVVVAKSLPKVNQQFRRRPLFCQKAIQGFEWRSLLAGILVKGLSAGVRERLGLGLDGRHRQCCCQRRAWLECLCRRQKGERRERQDQQCIFRAAPRRMARQVQRMKPRVRTKYTRCGSRETAAEVIGKSSQEQDFDATDPPIEPQSKPV